MRGRALALALIAAACGMQAGAQPAQPTAHDSTAGGKPARIVTPIAVGTWAIAPFIGAAMHSPAGNNWGITPDRNHLMLGVHLATPVVRAGPLTLLYAPNVVPFVMVTNNPRYRTVTSSGIARKVESGRASVYGAGLAPFGLQGEVRPSDALAVYSMAGLGGVWFSDVMPQDGAKRFNFSIEFGGGLVVRSGQRRALLFGYKFYHLSNMYTARENPGVDGHVFYVGARWHKRLPRE